tara:strand:- start:19535 stop:20143 length:609 start_codon:yes stop_codon:yes gene_type:complete
MKITLLTSGTTGKQKVVTHNETDFYKPAQFLCNKWKLNKHDIILNPFPNWTIANWAFCFFPAQLVGCEVVNIKMNPFKFWDIVDELRPTILTMAIGTFRTLLKRKIPNLNYIRNLSTGSARILKSDISLLKKTEAKNIWNIYGSTECIPPVLISNNEKFNFKNTPYYLEYNNSLIVDGFDTQDKFEDNECLEREKKFKTWKS